MGIELFLDRDPWNASSRDQIIHAQGLLIFVDSINDEGSRPDPNRRVVGGPSDAAGPARSAIALAFLSSSVTKIVRMIGVVAGGSNPNSPSASV